MTTKSLYRLVSRQRLTRADYDAMRDRANYSTLKAFAKSALHYRHALAERREETDALRVGIAASLAVLEPDRYAAEVAVWDGDKRGHAWKAFAEANSTRTILRTAQHDRVQSVAAAVRGNADAARYLDRGEGEVTALWTDAVTGIECRARLDWIAKVGAIFDLKTTRDAQPEAFARQSWNLAYHAQAAFYGDGVYAATGERLPSLIVAVESEAPFAVQVYDVGAEILDAGRHAYRGWLAQLAECRATNEWPGYASGMLALQAPKWADKTGEQADDERDAEAAQEHES